MTNVDSNPRYNFVYNINKIVISLFLFYFPKDI